MNPAARLSETEVAIFLFHGVVQESNYSVRNYTRKHLEADYFHRVIKELRAKGYPLSMDEVVGHIQAGEPFPPRAFAVTFDDGFENNYSVAAPILHDLGVPATFYVTTGFIEHNAMSWIDRIEYCLEIVPRGRLTFPWSPGAIHPFRDRTEKIRLLELIRERVKQDASIDEDMFVREVCEQCGVPEVRQSDDPLDRKMDWRQVRELNHAGGFTIGGHSHRHRVLSFLNSLELEAEVRTSIDLLERRAGIRPRHYSYPEGLAHCYSNAVIQTLRHNGIVCCPTAVDGMNPVTEDLFRLKRIMV